MRRGGEEPSLAFLVERSAELKRDLVRFAQSPRFKRWLVPAMLKVTDPGGELDEAKLIGVIDRFALQYRLPDGKTLVGRFVARRPDLTAADREMLPGCDDELVLPPAEAEEWLNAYYRHRQEAALARRSARPRPPNIPGVDVPRLQASA